MNKQDRDKLAYKASGVSIGANVLLSIGKFIAGVIANSGAMITDAIHSVSDVISTFVVIAGLKFSDEKTDASHEFGHERIECIASLILAMFLFITGLGIGWSGLSKIINNDPNSLAVPGILALIAAIVSIGVKEGMYWYTRGIAKKINSSSLMADAWHHRSDAFSSIGALVGILGARMGFPILDPIASVVICFFIGKASYDIFIDATNKLTDHSCDSKVEDEISETIKSVPGVVRIDSMKTRLFGSRIFVETEVSADDSISFNRSHQIAEEIHSKIEKDFPDVKHCMVHMNPINVKESSTSIIKY